MLNLKLQTQNSYEIVPDTSSIIIVKKIIKIRTIVMSNEGTQNLQIYIVEKVVVFMNQLYML